jgi:hypothetical protein
LIKQLLLRIHFQTAYLLGIPPLITADIYAENPPHPTLNIFRVEIYTMYKKFVFMAPADELIKELIISSYMNNYIHVFSVSRKSHPLSEAEGNQLLAWYEAERHRPAVQGSWLCPSLLVT